jgi:hypothetical protein
MPSSTCGGSARYAPPSGTLPDTWSDCPHRFGWSWAWPMIPLCTLHAAWSFLEFLRNQWGTLGVVSMEMDGGMRHMAWGGAGWRMGSRDSAKLTLPTSRPGVARSTTSAPSTRPGDTLTQVATGSARTTPTAPPILRRGSAGGPDAPAPPLESVDLERMAVDAIIAILPDGHTMPVASPYPTRTGNSHMQLSSSAATQLPLHPHYARCRPMHES